MDSAVVGDNPDQRKEQDPAGDLKHELATPFYRRSGCRFVFSGLHIRFVVPDFLVLDSRSRSVQRSAATAGTRRETRRGRRMTESALFRRPLLNPARRSRRLPTFNRMTPTARAAAGP
jgi:hypothetical protein